MVRRGASLVALAACLLTSVGAPPARAKGSTAGPPLGALRAVLKVRTDALRAKDREAYARTIDPRAPAAFRDAQLRSFDGLMSLPVARVNLSIARDDTDLTRGVDKAEYGGAPVALVPTTRALRFTYDARSALDSLFWTFVQRGDQWFVGGDDDVTDLGLETTVSMWDNGPVTLTQSEHLQLISHPAQQARAQELSGIAEQALATLSQRFSLPWSGKLVGFVPSSPAELADLIQSSVDVTKFVAFVGYDYNHDTLRATTPRLYVQDANLSVYSGPGQTETLVHEFAHAASSEYTGANIPVWVHEGIADWVAGGSANLYPRAAGSGDHAPLDDEFGAGSQGQIVRAYRDARSLVATLARVAGGPQVPFTFFKTLGGYTVRPGATPYLVDEALRAVGVADMNSLEADWLAGR